MRRDPEQRLARRVRGLEESGIRHLFDLARGLPDAVDLSIGQPCLGIAAAVKEAASAGLERDDGRYAPTEGLPEFLESLNRHLRQHFGVTQGSLIATCGITGGFHLACQTLFEEGDEVLLPDPGFVAHQSAVTHAGARPVFYDTYPDFRWRRASLEVALTPRTKGLVICNPGNPGGAVATEEELRAVVAFAREHHLWLLSDEAYGELVYDGAHCGIKRLAPEALLFGGFSKSHGIAGWRLGFVHGPAAVIEVLRHLQQFTATCAPTFAQRAMAPVLVEGNPEFRRHLRERRDLVVSILGDLLETPPQGGLFTFIPAPWGTGSEFSAACLRAGLVVVPGRSCSGRDTHIRLCFSAGLPQLRRGLDLLVEVARQEARG